MQKRLIHLSRRAVLGLAKTHKRPAMGHRLLRMLVDLAHGCIFNCPSLTMHTDLDRWTAFWKNLCGLYYLARLSLFLYSVLEAVVSPLDDGNGARPRAWLKIACINYQPSGRPTGTRFLQCATLTVTLRLQKVGNTRADSTWHQIPIRKVIVLGI